MHSGQFSQEIVQDGLGHQDKALHPEQFFLGPFCEGKNKAGCRELDLCRGGTLNVELPQVRMSRTLIGARYLR